MRPAQWSSVVTAAVLLGGCGLVDDAQEGVQKELAEQCVEHTGADEKTCACVAERLGESATLETLRDLIDAAARGETPPQMKRALRSCS